MKQLILKDYEIQNFPDKQILCLSGKEYKYLITVLRKKIGDSLDININNNIIKCNIINIDKINRLVKLIITETHSLEKFNLPNIILLQWILKGNKMDLVIRQATEAGVMHIFPIYGDFSVAQKEAIQKHDRRLRIVKEARQQSGSSIDTNIHKAMSLEKAISEIKNILNGREYNGILFTEKKETNNSLHQLLCNKNKKCNIMAIGAEGGISKTERQLLTKHEFKLYHFNTNILRAETATIYAIAAIQTLLTEESTWNLQK